MPVKLNIGLSRKVGEANYGSRGASIHLEVELDNGVLNDPATIRGRVRELYVLARQSVDDELQRPADSALTEPTGDANHRQGSGHVVTNDHTANSHVANGRGTNGHSSSGHSRNGSTNGHANGHTNRIEVARATQSQIRAIFAITKRQGLDPHKVISERFRVHRMEDLTIREASAIIEDLNSGAGVRA